MNVKDSNWKLHHGNNNNTDYKEGFDNQETFKDICAQLLIYF